MSETMNQRVGRLGEARAVMMLATRGYEMLKQNIHAPGGEIDILAVDHNAAEYVLVEVKTRSGNDEFGGARSAITKQKYHRMLQAAEWFFITKMGREELPPFRIEVVLIEGSKAEVLGPIGPDDFTA